MILNVWSEAPPDVMPLLELARAHGWRNLPLCANDVQVSWKQSPSDAPGGVMLRRHLPSRRYSAIAPGFELLMDALAWEAHEWQAIEAWRAQRKGRAA